MAAIGPLGAALQADGKVNVSAALNLTDPGSELPDGRIYISELDGVEFGDVVAPPTFDFWVGSSALDPVTNPPCQPGAAVPGHDFEPASISATVTVLGQEVAQANVGMSTSCSIDVGDEGWFNVTTDASEFELKNLTIDQVVLAIEAAVDYLKEQSLTRLNLLAQVSERPHTD